VEGVGTLCCVCGRRGRPARVTHGTGSTGACSTRCPVGREVRLPEPFSQLAFSPSHPMYTHIHTCMHACIHTCMHTYMHACMRAFIHTYLHARMHTYIQTDRQTNIQTYITEASRMSRFFHVLDPDGHELSFATPDYRHPRWQ